MFWSIADFFFCFCFFTFLFCCLFYITFPQFEYSPSLSLTFENNIKNKSLFLCTGCNLHNWRDRFYWDLSPFAVYWYFQLLTCWRLSFICLVSHYTFRWKPVVPKSLDNFLFPLWWYILWTGSLDWKLVAIIWWSWSARVIVSGRPQSSRLAQISLSDVYRKHHSFIECLLCFSWCPDLLQHLFGCSSRADAT